MKRIKGNVGPMKRSTRTNSNRGNSFWKVYFSPAILEKVSGTSFERGQ